MASVIRPASERGDIALRDRFSDSTFAYRFGRELPAGQLRSAIDLSTGGLVPDAVIYRDMPLESISARGRTCKLAGMVGPPDRIDQSGEAFSSPGRRGLSAACRKASGPDSRDVGRGSVETVDRDVRDTNTAAESGW